MGEAEEKTLDDIIEGCVEKYKLKVTDDNRDNHIQFLERQRAAHPDYDLNKASFRHGNRYQTYPYCRLLVDKLLLYSYLIGETIIIAGRVGNTEEKRIKSVDDLYVLQPGEFGEGKNNNIRRTDKRLVALYRSIGKHNYKYIEHGFPNWSMTIDEIGKDEEVVKHLGREIDTDVIQFCPSPYYND